jgi:chromosomal replication initiation ATPase DnaA
VSLASGSVHSPRPEVQTLHPAGRQSSRRTARRLCDVAVMATAAAFALPVAAIAAPTRRDAYTAFARQCAMYLAHVTFGLSFSEIGRAFGRDRTTAAHACRLVEDRRDDPAVERVVAALEVGCASLRQRLGVSVRS